MREIKFRAWDNVEEQMVYVNSLPLMQYTGLKDKNGKEIYEGDIVDCLAFKDEVIFENGMFTTKRGGIDKFGIKQPLAIHLIMELEVIGNIYETPELLGDKK